jgi:hypothetical protein
MYFTSTPKSQPTSSYLFYPFYTAQIFVYIQLPPYPFNTAKILINLPYSFYTAQIPIRVQLPPHPPKESLDPLNSSFGFWLSPARNPGLDRISPPCFLILLG